MFTLHLDGTGAVADVQAKLRDQEDLLYRLKAMTCDTTTGLNSFDFENALDNPAPGPSEFLSLRLFPAAQDDSGRAAVRESFVEFGGVIAADGVIRVSGETIYAIAFRGPSPELPSSHAESFDLPPNTLPAHVMPIFNPGGELAGIPWNSGEVVHMPLIGMNNDRVLAFRNTQTQKVEAFVMMTDADIDTDGPGGSKAIDPDYDPRTKLTFSNGASCDSRQFPGIVRSIRLFRNPLGLKMGDYVYICYKGRVVACQVYDQGPDDKIGEISLHAAYAVGGLSHEVSEHEAAIGGNFADKNLDLVTVCFPGSSTDNKAKPLADIIANTKAAFDQFVGGAASFQVQPPAAPAAHVPASAATPGSFTVYGRKSWGALAPKVDNFPQGAAQGIVIHNTEGANRTPAANPPQEVSDSFEISRRIQKDHMFSRGWSDVGQHFTISRGGVIMEGRDGTLAAAANSQVVRGAHAGVGQFNQHWWGIELEGDYTQPAANPTADQTTALNLLCSWLGGQISNFDANTHVRGHRQVKPGGTDCPGHLLDDHVPHTPDFIDALRIYLTGKAPAALTIQ